MRVLIIITLLFTVQATLARGIYQAPGDFVSNVFQDESPKVSVLWLTRKIRPGIKTILGHDMKVMRVRYWARDGRTVWVLEEAGKEEPITVGIVVKNRRLEQLKVLIYRESRGSEVRHPFFTNQFSGASLQADMGLDRTIDGISGATLSVRALKKLARLALYLDQQI